MRAQGPNGQRLQNSVMQPQLSDLQLITFNAIDHAVLFIDAARPKTRKRMLQGLGLANACIGITRRGFDQVVDAIDHLAVLLLPVKVVLPGLLGKNEFHLSNSRSTPWPALSCPTAASKRRALAGVRKR